MQNTNNYDARCESVRGGRSTAAWGDDVCVESLDSSGIDHSSCCVPFDTEKVSNCSKGGRGVPIYDVRRSKCPTTLLEELSEASVADFERRCARAAKSVVFSGVDSSKLDFISAALGGDFGNEQCTLPDSVLQAFEWMVVRTPAERMREREAIITGIEKLAAQLVSSGESEAWFLNADRFGSSSFSRCEWRAR